MGCSQENKKVVIIGGGPAGLTASYQLSKVQVKSLVLEKDQTMGGLSKTINYRNYYFDIGGHRFFTKIREVDNIWQEVLSDDFLRRKRLSRIYYNKKFFYYPLRAFNALFGLGLWNSFLIVASYVRAKLTSAKPEKNFEDWVSKRFGKRLYNIFFKTYTEKVWGIPCTEIRAEWAAQRIKGLSLMTALKNALIKSSNRIGDKRKVIKTLIEEFNYPKYGPGMMWKAVADRIEDNGSRVWLGARVEGILWSEDRVEALEVRRNNRLEVVSGTDFISSMPLKELIPMFKPSVPENVLDAAGNLKYRDFLTVAFIINKSHLFPDNWIYIHDPNVKVGRIQNFKNWSPYMVPDQDKTCLGLEYFCFEGDRLWNMTDDQLIELGKRELESLGFAKAEDIEEGRVVRVPKAYPIYDSNSEQSIEIIRRFFAKIDNFQLIGRNGQHKYNNQDHSMLTGVKAAENILGANHDLWQVNEEAEYQEEIRVKPRERAAWERIIAKAFVKMDKLALAAASGAVLGLLLFLATIFLIFRNGGEAGPTLHLHLLSQYFYGYTVTVKGAFIGSAYGFFWGFLFGWFFAYMRNLFIGYFIYRVKKKAEMLKFKDFLDHF